MPSDSEKRARMQHILPKSYLKRFSRDDKVWILDFCIPKLYHANIQDATCISHFYTVETVQKKLDDAVEQKLLAPIEGLAKPIIDQIISGWSLPERPDWDILANFLAIMYVRGPWFRAILRGAWGTLAREMAAWMHSDEETWRDLISQVQKETGKKVEMEFDEAVKAYKASTISVEVPTNRLMQDMMELASDLVGVFYKMTPNLWYIPAWTSARFIAADMPIVPVPRKENPPLDAKWLQNPDANLFFPLSSAHCLVLNYDQDRKVLPVSRKRVAFINHVLALNCSRLVVSQEERFVWLRERGTVSEDPEQLMAFVRATNATDSAH